MISKRNYLQVNEKVEEITFKEKENEEQGAPVMDLEQEQKTDTQLPKSPQVGIVDNKSKIAMQSSNTLRNVATYSTVRGQVSTKLIQKYGNQTLLSNLR